MTLGLELFDRFKNVPSKDLEQLRMEIRNNMNTYELFWSPTGQKIGTVEARTSSSAKRKAPQPYRKYLGEIYTELTKVDGYHYEVIGYVYTNKGDWRWFGGTENGEYLWTTDKTKAFRFDTKELCENTLRDIRRNGRITTVCRVLV